MTDEASPTVSAVPVGIPSAWRFIEDGEIHLSDNTLVLVLGRYGDVYGPMPVEMFHPDVWAGNMLHASHDATAVAVCNAEWRALIPLDARAIEARRAETQSGSVHESAVGTADAPETQQEDF